MTIVAATLLRWPDGAQHQAWSLLEAQASARMVFLPLLIIIIIIIHPTFTLTFETKTY